MSYPVAADAWGVASAPVVAQPPEDPPVGHPDPLGYRVAWAVWTRHQPRLGRFTRVCADPMCGSDWLCATALAAARLMGIDPYPSAAASPCSDGQGAQ